MSEFLGGMDCPDNVSYELHQLMVRIYKERVHTVTRGGKSDGKLHPDAFLSACISFIMDDDGSSGRENYAYWLNNRKEVK